MDPVIYKTYEIHCGSDKLTSRGWFPKAYIKRSSDGQLQHVHTVFGGTDETYSTEVMANAIATGLAKAWIDLPPQDEITGHAHS